MAAQGADGADRALAEAGAERLGGVFHHRDAAGLGRRQYGAEVRALSVQVHGDDGAGARRQRRGGGVGGRAQRLRVHVHEHGLCAHAHDGRDRRDEGEGGRHHLVAAPHVEGPERQRDRVGPGSAPHRFFDAQPGGELALECDDLLAKNELLRFQHPREGPVRAAPIAIEGAAEVDQRHGFRRRHCRLPHASLLRPGVTRIP
jgi:hypothetical protein